MIPDLRWYWKVILAAFLAAVPALWAWTWYATAPLWMLPVLWLFGFVPAAILLLGPR